MKTLILLSLLLGLLIPFQSPTLPADGASPLSVSSFKWARTRRKVDIAEAEGTAPARAMIPQNRNFARNARVNDPQGVRDPNADTLDGRSAAIEKSVQESRTPKPKATDGYTYRLKIQNPGKNVVDRKSVV